MTAVLSVHGLTIEATTGLGPVKLVHDVNLDLHEGEILGLIGESGSGKSTAVRSMIGLLERNVRVSSGEIALRGEVISSESVNHFEGVRGSEIGMIFQSAAMSLNPLMKVGKQLREVVRRHQKHASAKEIDQRLELVLRKMGFTDTDRVLGAFPHQLSGGMRQRIAIGLAIVTEPAVVIADECTSALDVTTQAEVVKLLRTLTSESRTAMLFVTHDLMLAKDICSQIAVMYAGEIVETGEANELIDNPRHPYTRALLQAIPTWGTDELQGIEGSPPPVAADWQGCRFAPRCPLARDECRQQNVGWTRLGDRSGARCVVVQEEEVRIPDSVLGHA
ncbi:oligopeptide/dipeptide ABC transporter ATP-binding protein [Arthrobacter ginsengisoli]|uniref:Oligopeptide/dipeptide ABC transporter ATP-binding protein n=1 Tax=Arthrobacter ginsengisoli TaxID=1356565 RepID=A0ABU1UI18_9MICC|nr:ABC transporter ATP-binding protein [Arthrobacter ginsengisoli]MDR7084839.1 oligopeptide/dipeptide ABC transporter ATP-binding protein [Arthrobacter ginsengisoli]